MREIFKLTATGGTITVNGSVISNNTADFMQEFGGAEDYICPRDITEALSRLDGQPLTVEIGTCYGGDMWAGCNIYSALMAYKGPVEYRVYGLSASAATIILMASAKEDSRCLISPVGALFVHNVQSEVYGDYRDMQRESDDLQKANKIIMEAYKLKTDLPDEEIQAMLDADTLLTADAALANRFVDGILFQDGQQIMGDSDEVWEKAGSKLNNMAADGLRQNLRAMYCYLNRDMAHKVRDMQHKAHAQKQETDTEAEAARLKIEKERFGG